MTGTDARDLIFIAPLYLPGRAYVLVATYYGEQGGWYCDDWMEHLEELCEDGGTIFVEGQGGNDTIDLLWSDSDTMGAGHIVDGSAREEYRWALEQCWEAKQPVYDFEQYMAKADFLYEYCTTAELDGGPGRDVIRGTPAGGVGTEALFGGEDSDGLFGNGGFDLLQGGAGNDWIACGNEVCYAYGEGDDDYISGGSAPDHLDGGSGSDFIVGWGGGDEIHGGAGADYIFGYSGVDHIWGDGDNDTLAGGLDTDVFDGGTGTDTFWCRLSDSAIPLIDPANAATDCSERPLWAGDRGMEATERRDPYTRWVRRFERTVSFGPAGNGKSYDITFETTSSLARMQVDDSSGANFLYQASGVPLYSRRIQSYWTCGPQSLEMVLRYLGLTEEHPYPEQLVFPRSIGQYGTIPERWDVTPYLPDPARWDVRPGADNANEVSVGYRYSAEHIVLDALSQRYWFEPESWPPRQPDGCDPYLVAGTDLLRNEASGVPGDEQRISYLVGGYDPLQNPGGTLPGDGPLQVWDVCSPGVGMEVGDEDEPWGGRLLAGVANRAAADQSPPQLMDAKVVSNEMIGTADHFQDIVAGFIDNEIPLAMGVERGGHFNAVIGYWRYGSKFYLYTADPLDGGLRDYTVRPMRWQRFVLDQNLMDSRVITGLLLFGHVERGGCEPGEWAWEIDDAHGPLLCD